MSKVLTYAPFILCGALILGLIYMITVFGI
jgi:hypothetical protein